MIPEGFDRTISIGITIATAGFGFWVHHREMAKERKRALLEAQQKYAEKELKEYAAKRDFGHIEKDLIQLKANIEYLNQQSDQRLDRLERQLEKNAGSLEILKDLARDRPERAN